MVTHDERQAEENSNWELLSADEKLVRLRGFVLEGNGCQCEECLWEYGSVFGGFGVGAIPLLVSALRHECLGIRMMAAEALGKLGPAARDAIPALRISLNDEDGPPANENSVAGIAASALKRIRPGGSRKRRVPEFG
jgi:HEAT repeat protein